MTIKQIYQVSVLARKTLRDADIFKSLLGEAGLGATQYREDAVDKLVDKRGKEIESILTSVPVEHLYGVEKEDERMECEIDFPAIASRHRAAHANGTH